MRNATYNHPVLIKWSTPPFKAEELARQENHKSSRQLLLPCKGEVAGGRRGFFCKGGVPRSGEGIKPRNGKVTALDGRWGVFRVSTNLMVRFLFLSCFFLFSCSQKQQAERPAYLINKDEMVKIMVDMHLVETAANLKVYPPDSAQQLYQNNFASIFLTHGVTQEKYDSSLFYYATQTNQMNIIYDQVLESLSELESEVNSDQ